VSRWGACGGGWGGTVGCLYACKLVNVSYTGATLNLRASNDTTGTSTQDFYADSTGSMYTGYNNTGTSLSAWLTSKGGLTTYAFVTTWYDQSNSGNHATQSTTTVQPIYDVSAKIINFGNTTAGYGIASPQTNCYFNIRDGAFPYGDSSFTYITSYRNAPTGGILFSGGKNNNTGGQAGNCSMLLNSVN